MTPQERLAAAHANQRKAAEELRNAQELAALDLDADTRTAEQQADEFFNRPGDYHQVHVDVPIVVDGNGIGEWISAQCVVKFTPDQRDLVIEILRQLRGALGARITVTRLENPSPEVEKPEPATIDPAYDIGRDFTLGDRYSEADWQREEIATQFGVPIDCVKPAGSPTGDLAWTVTPPTDDTPGKHAAPDENDVVITCKRWMPGNPEQPDAVFTDQVAGIAVTTTADGEIGKPYRPDDIYRAHQQRLECSILSTSQTRTHTGQLVCTRYSCGCGQQVAADTTEEHAQQLWDAHRRTAFEAALLNTHDHVHTGDNE